MSGYQRSNVINFHFIDYIIKSYVPELQFDQIYSRINMALFREAMLHSSTKYKSHHKTYERLEYLGDAVFHLVITEYFYKRYDEENEGFLTRLRIRIERGDSMAELTKILELDNYIQIYDISLNNHILEDVFEAFIGAFYLNFGIKYTRTFVIALVERHKDLSELISRDDNYKDLLLRYFHQKKWGYPIYNKEKTNFNKFKSSVKTPDGIAGIGVGNSKKKAEQNASKDALEKLGVIVNDEIDIDWMDKIEKEEKEIKEKEKPDKKPMPVFNPSNKLLTKEDIKKNIKSYGARVPKDFKVKLKIFYEAMTHRSYLIRKNLTPEEKSASVGTVKLQKKSNERLQFMGDAVIHFVIGEFLFSKYENNDEGFLTRLRCKLENQESLFYLAVQSDISSFILISQNIEVLHGRNNINIIGGGMKAFIGALYLQLGLGVSREYFVQVMRTELNIDEIAENETNYKDLILQLYNKEHWGRPDYRVLKEEGPDHSKIFTMGLYLNDKLVGQGRASSKKKAEQIASKKMYLKYMKNE